MLVFRDQPQPAHIFKMFYEHIIRAAGHAGETRLTRFSHIENGIVLNMKNEITKAAESDTVYVRFNGALFCATGAIQN